MFPVGVLVLRWLRISMPIPWLLLSRSLGRVRRELVLVYILDCSPISTSPFADPIEYFWDCHLSLATGAVLIVVAPFPSGLGINAIPCSGFTIGCTMVCQGYLDRLRWERG